MKKVIVTGANGFIGREICHSLISNGYEVHALSSTKASGAEDKLTWHNHDLLSCSNLAPLLKEIGAVSLIHSAWYTEHGKYWSAPVNLEWVAASLNLLKAFHKAGGMRTIFLGTCAEYDWNYGYCIENLTPCNPSSLYGICKFSLQQIFEKYCYQVGLSAAWGRIFLLFGENENTNRLVPQVINSALRREPILCSHGKQVRDILHVSDIADSLVALLESNVCGPVNIGSGEYRSVADIVLSFAKKLDCSELAKFGAITAPQSDAPLLIPSIERLRNEVRWSPVKSFEQRVEQVIEWYKQRT